MRSTRVLYLFKRKIFTTAVLADLVALLLWLTSITSGLWLVVMTSVFVLVLIAEVREWLSEANAAVEPTSHDKESFEHPSAAQPDLNEQARAAMSRHLQASMNDDGLWVYFSKLVLNEDRYEDTTREVFELFLTHSKWSAYAHAVQEWVNLGSMVVRRGYPGMPVHEINNKLCSAALKLLLNGNFPLLEDGKEFGYEIRMTIAELLSRVP